MRTHLPPWGWTPLIFNVIVYEIYILVYPTHTHCQKKIQGKCRGTKTENPQFGENAPPQKILGTGMDEDIYVLKVETVLF